MLDEAFSDMDVPPDEEDGDSDRSGVGQAAGNLDTSVHIPDSDKRQALYYLLIFSLYFICFLVFLYSYVTQYSSKYNFPYYASSQFQHFTFHIFSLS